MTDQPDDLLAQLPNEDALPEGHISGFVAVIGRPNVGKSTLMNAILGEKIAIVSPKPQTTRLRQLGIYTRPDLQIIFVDTPGIHNPRTPLGEFMVSVAVEALRDADVILFVVDVSEPPAHDDRNIADLIRAAQDVTPVVMALNKVDLAPDPDQLAANLDAHRALVPVAESVPTVALLNQGTGDVLARLVERLPAGPRYYPEDQLSDITVRNIVAEIVREKVLVNLEQEVPHGVATEVNEFKHWAMSLTEGQPVYSLRTDFNNVERGPTSVSKEEAMQMADFVIVTMEAERPGTLQYLDYSLQVHDARLVYLPFVRGASGLTPGF